MAELEQGRSHFDHIVTSSEAPHSVEHMAGSTTVEHIFTDDQLPDAVIRNTHLGSSQQPAGKNPRPADDYPLK